MINHQKEVILAGIEQLDPKSRAQLRNDIYNKYPEWFSGNVTSSKINSSWLRLNSALKGDLAFSNVVIKTVLALCMIVIVCVTLFWPVISTSLLQFFVQLSYPASAESFQNYYVYAGLFLCSLVLASYSSLVSMSSENGTRWQNLSLIVLIGVLCVAAYLVKQQILFLLLLPLAILFWVFSTKIGFVFPNQAEQVGLNKTLTLFVAVVIILATALRLAGLGSHPQGYPQHTLFHFETIHRIFLQHFDAILHFNQPLSHLYGIFMNVLDAQQGLISLVESVLYWVFQPTLILTRLLPIVAGIFSLYIFFSTIARVWGRAVGLCFLVLLAFSPWHIAFSRYSDLEHISSVLHIGLMAWALVRFNDGEARSAWWLGAIAGIGMYLYAPNQIVSLAVFPILLAYMYSRVGFEKIKIASLVYLGLFIFPALNAWSHGKLIPIRTPYESGDKSYSLGLSADLSSKTKSLIESLFNQSPDAWYMASVGALTPIEQILLLLSLGGAIYLGARALFSTKLQRDSANVLILFFAALIFLGAIPSYISPDVFVRRLLLMLIGLVFFSSLLLGGLLERAPIKWFLPLFLTLLGLQFTTGKEMYFNHVGSFESEFNLPYSELSDEVLARVKPEQSTLICIPGDYDVDTANSALFANFVFYSSPNKHFASEWRADAHEPLQFANSKNCVQALEARRYQSVMLFEYKTKFQAEFTKLAMQMNEKLGVPVVDQTHSQTMGQWLRWN